MLNFICNIPEELGWAIVGMLALLCLESFAFLIYTIVQAIRWRLEEIEECCKKSEE